MDGTCTSRLRSLLPIAACLLLAAGCGGSGGNMNGGGSGEPPDPPDPPDPPPGNVTVTVMASDAFGSPVPDAEIMLLNSSGTGFLEVSTRTDVNGRVEIVGGFEDVYAILMRAEELYGTSYEPSRPTENRIDFAVTLHPSSAFTPGVGQLSVTGISGDGRQLEFSARLYVVEGHASYPFEEWNIGGVDVLPCELDAGNDTVTFTADCIAGPAGFDVAYGGSALTWDWVDPNAASYPLAIGLLLDQGASVALTDPADRRLLGARYFQTRLDADDQVALAAFAADDASTGEVALLPDQPVTILPVADPGFTTDGRTYFPVIESLATLEGGASPLHAAIGEMIAFTASAAPVDSRRAVVVLASGDVSDCTSPADCQVAQAALRDLSAATEVAVLAVGLSEPSGQYERMKLGTLAQAEQGAVFWAQHPTQVPTVLGHLPEILGGGHGAVDATIRLESPTAGAFVAGHTVAGTLRIILCPWDCDGWIDVPFALSVP